MLLKLDFDSEVPIYQQIRNQIVVGIASGQLSPGERLPATRALGNGEGPAATAVRAAAGGVEPGRNSPTVREAV